MASVATRAPALLAKSVRERDRRGSEAMSTPSRSGLLMSSGRLSHEGEKRLQGSTRSSHKTSEASVGGSRAESG